MRRLPPVHELAEHPGDQSRAGPQPRQRIPFGEAHFKTLKYQPDSPGFFAGMLHARGWLELFFAWHNDDHQHSGLALFTPAEVFFGRVPAVHRVRQDTLDAQYALHPDRFPNGPPKAPLPPTAVHINPLEALAVSVAVNARPIDDTPPADRSRMASRATASTPRHETHRPAIAPLPS